MAKPANTDEYIATFSQDVQALLLEVREAILQAAPQATEVISYGMPAFKFHGMLVWIGAHTSHIGFYPRASAIERFSKELSVYKNAKGSVQFPFNRPMPLELIKEMVRFRVAENLHKEKGR